MRRGREVHAVLRHAVGAAEVAPLGERDPEDRVPPAEPVGERVGGVRRVVAEGEAGRDVGDVAARGRDARRAGREHGELVERSVLCVGVRT